ncbi:YggS family pyridoxal phosphate-dependent enzyme [soil metagenome]
MAISKTVPAGHLGAAVAAGLTCFGENRVQEAAAKVPHVPDAEWHLVGRLQGNKARRAVELFSAIHSLDSRELAGRLDRMVREVGRRDPLPVYLQVNVDGDPAKGGFDPRSVERVLPDLVAMEALEIRGLMTVGRQVPEREAARPTFASLRQLSAHLHRRWPALGAGLSMGMSDDFEVAVEEGSTLVRVGRALFGERPPV